MGDGQDRAGRRREHVGERLRPLLPTGVGDQVALEDVERRRRQQFGLTAFVALGAAAIAAASLLWDGIDLPAWAAVLLLAATVVFLIDASTQDRTLRDVTRAVVAERSRSRDLEETLGDLAALQTIAGRVNQVLLPEEIYEVVLAGAVELLDAVQGSIRLRVDDRLAVAASVGVWSPPIGETVVAWHDVVSPVISLGITMVDRDPPRIAVPVQVGERIVGVLQVARDADGDPFTERQELLARLFADEAATAFVNANRYDHERTRADVAISASEDRTDAVADTVHDLRAPLAGLVGFAELLRERHDRLTPEQRRDAAADIHRQATVLDDRIGAMFDAATAEARATRTREPVDLADVAREAVETVRAGAEREGWPHQVRLEVADDAVVAGDRDALLRVTTNLVANAVEHAGPSVLVRVQRRGREVRLHVADRGDGIPSERLAGLFSRRRPPGDDRARGRGLPIVDTLVKAMGGRVGVRSQPGVGSVFTVMLPPSP